MPGPYGREGMSQRPYDSSGSMWDWEWGWTGFQSAHLASFSAVVTSGSSVSRGKEQAPPSRSQCLFCRLFLLSLWVGKCWMQGGSGKRGSRTGHWQPPVAGARPEATCGFSCS